MVRFVVSIDKSLQHVCKDHVKLTSSKRHPTLVRVLSYITELCRHRHKWVLSGGPYVLHRTRFYININVCLLRLCYISHLPPLRVYVCNNSVVLLILYIVVLNQNVYVFEKFSFFLNISFLNIKAFLNQLLNLFQIMLSSRPYALMDTFLFLEAFSLVSQYVISMCKWNRSFRVNTPHVTPLYASRSMYIPEENCSANEKTSWRLKRKLPVVSGLLLRALWVTTDQSIEQF